MFLAGVSAYLQFAKGKTTPQLSMFLLTRGLWLIFLELTVLSFGWSFGVPVRLLPASDLGHRLVDDRAGGAGLAAAHGGARDRRRHHRRPQSARSRSRRSNSAVRLLWTFLHEGGPIFVGEQPIGLVAYPVLPWIGVIALGYGLGALFTERAGEARPQHCCCSASPCSRRSSLLRLASMSTAIRTSPTGPEAVGAIWREQATLGAALMVFFDVQKYPPSLQFTLVTLGIVLRRSGRCSRACAGRSRSVLNTFGAVPFFFYVLHIYLVHTARDGANAAPGSDVSGFFNYLINVFTAPERLQGVGFTLPWVYLAWIVVLAILYPLCRYWQQLKARRRDWWLSYL